MRNPEFRGEVEQTEKGRNNRILLKIMRHGEKTPDGHLTDYGREATSETAKNEQKIMEGIDKIKVMGSNSGPKNEAGQARAMETSQIYGDTVTEESDEEVKKYESRARSILEVRSKTQRTPDPFDWGAEYKDNLPENFEDLPDEEKAKASHIANEANLDKLISIPEGEDYRKEIAARYAMYIDTYLRMIERIDSNNNIAYPSGAHGGHIELFLQKCLKRKTKEGKEILGFEDSKELGGSFRPSEGFFIDITTDESGEKNVKFSFENGGRFEGEELSLDLDKMQELIAEYKEKHGSYYTAENNKEE